MEACYGLLLSVLFCCCLSAMSASHFAVLFPVLSDDVVAQFGHSVVIPFSWSGSEQFQICHYARNESDKQFIYTGGKSLIGDGFTVRRNNTGSRYELVIDSVRHDHAGIYDLIVNGNVASERHLTVFSGPSCDADRSSNVHEAYYRCSLQHTGPAQPVMEWPELGECSETDTSNTYNSAGLSTRKSSCTVAVLHSNEHILRHSKSCILSFIDGDTHKLRQTYTCTAIMPQSTPSPYHWLGTSDLMYVRLGHIMYLLVLGLTVFTMYCLRHPFTWMLKRAQMCCGYLSPCRHNSNGMKQESGELNTALQVIDI